MTEEQCEMSERCVRGLGYQGQNLLCSNWNVENMSELDYNGMFEYLYGMKYGEKFNSEDYPNGIPKEEFESLIMEYLPITAEQIESTQYLMRKTRLSLGETWVLQLCAYLLWNFSAGGCRHQRKSRWNSHINS